MKQHQLQHATQGPHKSSLPSSTASSQQSQNTPSETITLGSKTWVLPPKQNMPRGTGEPIFPSPRPPERPPPPSSAPPSPLPQKTQTLPPPPPPPSTFHQANFVTGGNTSNTSMKNKENKYHQNNHKHLFTFPYFPINNYK
ncbi:UNVERIFIED_CONTAM: hypothetical protein RMT77_018510 [Armadillidium vulgare]